MTAGFSVSCPGLGALVERMRRVDLTEVYAGASVQSAQHAASLMATAAQESGDHSIASTIGVITAEDGVVHAGSRHPDAEQSEYGSLDTPPAAWLRDTLAGHGDEISEHYADQLTAHLGRAMS